MRNKDTLYLYIFTILYSAELPALVVKASVLAAGKGVMVCGNKDQACQAVVDMLKVKV